jgi:hypothetical protein
MRIIFNFAKFVNWPETQEATGGDFRLCISRNNPIVKYLNQLEGRPLRNFTLRVLVPSTKEALGTCHIIYIPDEYDPSHALSEIDNYPVLTVGDQSGFIEQGGAIQLVTENNRVSFDVNLQHIRTVGLEINAKVLQLARKVY